QPPDGGLVDRRVQGRRPGDCLLPRVRAQGCRINGSLHRCSFAPSSHGAAFMITLSGMARSASNQTPAPGALPASGCVLGLRCKECHREYPKEAIYVCEFCFGPLEVVYDYDAAARTLHRDAIARRPQNLWRYRELLPLDGQPT